MCTAGGGMPMAMCANGQWSTCSCVMGSTAAGGNNASGTATGAVTAAQCGNGKAEGDEQCDGTDLKGMTCATLGMGAATSMLKCNTRCAFDTLLCGQSGGMASGGTGAAQGGSGARTTTSGTAGSGGSGR
jgi:hypothetical protein